MQLADECEERQELEPLIVVLDSMGGRQDTAVQNILQYLSVEWRKNAFIDKSHAVFPFDSSEMVVIVPNCPGQQDYTSCGLYLIHYLSKIFENIDRFCTLHGYKNIQNWDNHDEILRKRFDIATLLRNVSREQGRYGNLSFPNVKFFQSDVTDEFQKTNEWNISSQEAEDRAYFDAYVKAAAEHQTDFSLCRQYKPDRTVSGDRYRQLIILLSQCQHSLGFKGIGARLAQSMEISQFKEYLKVRRDEYPYTEVEMMYCLEQMEEEGFLMIDSNTIFFLK